MVMDPLLVDAQGGGGLASNWPTVNAASRVIFGGIPAASQTTATDVGGGNTGTGRTFLLFLVTDRILEDGQIKRLKITTTQGGTGVFFRVFRPHQIPVTTWDFVGQSESITTGVGAQTIVLGTPINCQPGDALAVFLPDDPGISRTRVGCTTAGAGNTIWNDADNQGSNVTFANSLASRIDLEGDGVGPLSGCTGDSIIAGHNVDNATSNGQWLTQEDTTGPANTLTSEPFHQLRGLLTATHDYTYQNHAMGGQTYAWVRSTGFPALVTLAPKIYLIHCGINDVIGGRTWAAVSADLDAIKLTQPANTTLFINEILPASTTTDPQAATLRTFNANLATWCSANSATLISLWATFGQLRVSTGFNDDLLAAFNRGDGVHLSQAGVNQLATSIKAAHTAKFGA